MAKKKPKTKKNLPSLDLLVHNEVKKHILVTNVAGDIKGLTKQEVLVRSVCKKAMKGEPHALKKWLEWCKEFLPPEEGPLPNIVLGAGFFSSIPFDQHSYDLLKEGGYLPADAPALLEGADEEMLNKAHSKWKKHSKAIFLS